MLALPRDHLDVVVGQLAPAFLHVALELLPVSLDAIPVHVDSLASGVRPACDVGAGGFSVMASACMSRRLRILPHAVGALAYIGRAPGRRDSGSTPWFRASRRSPRSHFANGSLPQFQFPVAPHHGVMALSANEELTPWVPNWNCSASRRIGPKPHAGKT